MCRTEGLGLPKNDGSLLWNVVFAGIQGFFPEIPI